MADVLVRYFAAAEEAAGREEEIIAIPEATLGALRADGGVGVLVEELEVAAVVEDQELGLVVAGAEQIGTKAGAATQHLPELRLRPDHLEEHQVDHVGHVDAGVQHVDGDRNVRLAGRDRELVDQVLGVLRRVGDDPSEVAFVVRVIRVEPFDDELGVPLILGEDDCLAEPVPTCDLLAAGHQVFENLVDGVGVE